MDDATFQELMNGVNQMLDKGRARLSGDEMEAYEKVLAGLVEDGVPQDTAAVRALSAVETFTRIGFRIVRK